MPASPRRRSQVAADSRSTARLLLRRLLQEHALLLREVAELRALRDDTYHDALTGLRNARYLQVRLNEELQRGAGPGGGSVSIVVLEIEGLGRLVERHGRAAGDRVFSWLGRQLLASLRTSDVCCRSGADEFTLILPDTDRAGAETTFFRLNQAIGEARGEEWMPLALAAGLATWPREANDVAGLLACASRSLRRDRRGHSEGRTRLRLVP